MEYRKEDDITVLKGIDCSVPVSKAVAEALYAQNYRFVCRYLVPDVYSKHLSAQEAKILSDAGLKILCVYETTAARPRGGAKNGSADGAAACEAARLLQMPASGIIFFAADFDASSGDMDNIEAYLRAARAQTGVYKVGIYGSFSVVESMAARKACDGFWQTYAWSGKKKPIHATVYQYLNDQNAFGIKVDYNEAYSETGMWNYHSDTGGELNMTIDEAKTELTTISGTGDTHSAWADAAITKLTAAGIFSGDGNGNFGWEQCMTREAVAVAFYKLIDKLGLSDKL